MTINVVESLPCQLQHIIVQFLMDKKPGLDNQIVHYWLDCDNQACFFGLQQNTQNAERLETVLKGYFPAQIFVYKDKVGADCGIMTE